MKKAIALSLQDSNNQGEDWEGNDTNILKKSIEKINNIYVIEKFGKDFE